MKKIERDFIDPETGYRCIVLVHAGCIRCGYVGVTAEHKLYGKLDAEEDYYFGVHGGVTFTGHLIDFYNDLWFFGFDFAHFGDRFAVDEALEYGLVVRDHYVDFCKEMNKSCVFDASIEQAVENCLKLAKELKYLEL